MKNNNEYNELLAEQKKQREELKTKIELNKFISSKTKIPFKVYVGGIPKFGYFGSIHFKDLFREENANKKELLELLETFKPTKMFLHSDGGTSFLPILLKEGTSTEVLPYEIHYNGFDNRIAIKWFTKLKNKVYQIEVFINESSLINEFLNVKYDRINFKGGYRIDNVACHINGNFDDGNFKKITWGRGSEEYANDFSIYSEKADIDFIDYVKT